MKINKKFIASATSAALVASAIVPVASAASFSDIENNTHKDAILALAEAGIISGYTDGTFKPNAQVTRGNVTKLLGKWLVTEGYEIPADYNTVERFTDVPVTHADQELVKFAALVKDNGVFNGSNGKLMQANNMSREQMAVVLVRAIKTVYGVDLVADYKAANFESNITDLDKATADENREAIIALEYAELTTVTAFNPNNSLTRGQFASFLHRAITNISKEEVKEAEVESVKSIDSTTLEVVLSGEVKEVAAEDFVFDNELKVLKAEIKKAAETKEAVTKTTVILTTSEQKEGTTYSLVSYKGEKPSTEIKVEKPVVEEVKVESVSAINPTSVKVTFNKAVEALVKADITVTNKDNNKVLIKSVTLSEDKQSVTVEFYDALTTGDYKVAVKDAGEASFKYEVGVPTTIVAETAQKFDAAKTGKVAYKVLDQNGLDITATLKAGEVTFQSTDSSVVDETGAVKSTGTAKSAFVNIVVKKEGSTTELKSNRITVTTEEAALKEITDYTVAASADFTSPTYKQNTKVALGDTAKTLHVTGKDQFGETATTEGAKFESLDLDVAVVDATTGKITPIKEGKFAVKVTVGNVTKTVELEVVATAKLTSLVADKESVTLSSEATVPAEVKVVAKDQNGTDFTTEDYTTNYTVEATTEAGKALVNVTLKEDGTVEVTPKSKEAGTATIEVKHKTDTTIKTVFTVKVEKAGAVADYKLVGFEVKLDKFTANTEKTPSTATLTVIPVDANGAQAGAPVANASYVVTDKDGKVVESAVTVNKIDVAKLEVGKYTLTTKVGTVVVSAQEFEVVNTEVQPTIEFTATTVTNTDDSDLFAEVKNAIKVIPGTTAQEEANLKVTGIKFVSTDSTFVDSQTDDFATAITVKKDGNADLLISEVQIKTNTEDATYTVKLSSNFKLAVSSTAVAKELADAQAELQTVIDSVEFNLDSEEPAVGDTVVINETTYTVSADGADVSSSDQWVTTAHVTTLKEAVEAAKAAKTAEEATAETVKSAKTTLEAAITQFTDTDATEGSM